MDGRDGHDGRGGGGGGGERCPTYGAIVISNTTSISLHSHAMRWLCELERPVKRSEKAEGSMVEPSLIQSRSMSNLAVVVVVVVVVVMVFEAVTDAEVAVVVAPTFSTRALSCARTR